MQKQETVDDFPEHANKRERLVHTARSGQWHGVLPEATIEMIRTGHGDVMRAFGYLDD